MNERTLGHTGLSIAPLVLGGNVFGWTIDARQSFAVLDAFVDHGFDAIDTADLYSRWADGNQGGESEAILGDWLHQRPGMRDRVQLFTKVGAELGQGRTGLSQRWILQEVEDSLARLRTDHIDLYFAHFPDADTPFDETLGAFQKLLDQGKIRAVGASNLDSDQLEQSLRSAQASGVTPYQVLQPEYNLYDRDAFDGALRDTCIEHGLGVVTYFSLASGFLTGKYRSKQDQGKSPRGGGMGKYLNARGERILAALDRVAAAHEAQPADVALAWLIAQRGVTAPIVSATRLEHVAGFARAASLSLDDEQLADLDRASA